MAVQVKHGRSTNSMLKKIDAASKQNYSPRSYEERDFQQPDAMWDPLTNMILGVCCKHGGSCSLEFCSMVEPKALLSCLHNKTVHLASEATVIAVTLLNGESKGYAAQPFCISPTSVKAAKESQSASFRIPYYLASDGAANQRQGASALTLKRKLTVRLDGDLFCSFSNLPLFNILCGDNHLEAPPHHIGFMTPEIAASLLAPNNHQDVTLMVHLLNALASLPELPLSASPSTKATRHILILLGELYHHLLDAYLDVDALLSKQLACLSTAAHLILALYNESKGGFIPVQLYFNVMSMIKNAYFCIAKTQRDNPLGCLWLILLGANGLEKVFGMV
ncbi:hypothetical protein BT96DRAFT_943084 [Gymnopus androsaceus JB14]|uniref:Uncharacterized protein n=1 Tax=Gymnopus androsaceus JB14 TaxID=1447944 RepID=A0A6A4HA63_9AGAR|nr:hypothetical protein BT96DRAFT_943084 [Gymnopus androsaceus JB14]